MSWACRNHTDSTAANGVFRVSCGRKGRRIFGIFTASYFYFFGSDPKSPKHRNVCVSIDSILLPKDLISLVREDPHDPIDGVTSAC